MLACWGGSTACYGSNWVNLWEFVILHARRTLNVRSRAPRRRACALRMFQRKAPCFQQGWSGQSKGSEGTLLPPPARSSLAYQKTVNTRRTCLLAGRNQGSSPCQPCPLDFLAGVEDLPQRCLATIHVRNRRCLVSQALPPGAPFR